MPTLANYKTDNYLKMLLIGESGSGKTGALASLAKAGYKLRILDFDSGLDILPEVLHNDPAAMGNIEYESCTDKLKSIGGKIVPEGVPKGYEKAMNLLTKWGVKNGAEKDLGRPSEWGRDTFIIIDSLSHMGNAAMRRVQALNGRSGEKIWQDEWGTCQNMLENCLALLYSEDFKCNVIVTAHVKYIGGRKGDDGEPDDPRPMTGLPNAPGVALSPKVPSYFNSMLLCKQEGTGKLAKRVIYTIPDGLVGVKQPFVGGDIPTKLPIDTGLGTFAEKALGKMKKGKEL